MGSPMNAATPLVALDEYAFGDGNAIPETLRMHSLGVVAG